MTDQPGQIPGLRRSRQLIKQAFTSAGFRSARSARKGRPPNNVAVKTEHGRIVVNLSTDGIEIDWIDLGGEFTFLFPEVSYPQKFEDGITARNWDDAAEYLSRLRKFLEA